MEAQLLAVLAPRPARHRRLVQQAEAIPARRPAMSHEYPRRSQHRRYGSASQRNLRAQVATVLREDMTESSVRSRLTEP